MDKNQMNVDEIVLDLSTYAFESEQDVKDFLSINVTNLHGLHHSFGRFIRNTYGLWADNPLTEKWRTDENGRTIVNNVDYSKDHPDAISMEIIEKLHKFMEEKSLGS